MIHTAFTSFRNPKVYVFVRFGKTIWFGNVCTPMSLLRNNKLSVVCTNTSKSLHRCHYGYLISNSSWSWSLGHCIHYYHKNPAVSHSSRMEHSQQFVLDTQALLFTMVTNFNCSSTPFTWTILATPIHLLNTHSVSLGTRIPDFTYRYHNDYRIYNAKLRLQHHGCTAISANIIGTIMIFSPVSMVPIGSMVT